MQIAYHPHLGQFYMLRKFEITSNKLCYGDIQHLDTYQGKYIICDKVMHKVSYLCHRSSFFFLEVQKCHRPLLRHLILSLHIVFSEMILANHFIKSTQRKEDFVQNLLIMSGVMNKKITKKKET